MMGGVGSVTFAHFTHVIFRLLRPFVSIINYISQDSQHLSLVKPLLKAHPITSHIHNLILHVKGVGEHKNHAE